MDANPYLQTLGINTAGGQPGSPQTDFRNAMSNGLFGWWWYPFMNHINQLARQANPNLPPDPAWEAIMKARNPQRIPSPYLPPNMTGARG